MKTKQAIERARDVMRLPEIDAHTDHSVHRFVSFHLLAVPSAATIEGSAKVTTV
jgi:hypothetical protein